jgi:hypothetical protein
LNLDRSGPIARTCSVDTAQRRNGPSYSALLDRRRLDPEALRTPAEPMTEPIRSIAQVGTDHATETVTAVAGRLRRGLRLFSSAGDQPRARRATDVILLTISFVGIVFVGH